MGADEGPRPSVVGAAEEPERKRAKPPVALQTPYSQPIGGDEDPPQGEPVQQPAGLS